MSEKCDHQTLTVPKDAKPEEIQTMYDKFATTYDEEIEPETAYPALKATVKTFAELVGDSNQNLKIIDLGAGTGHASLELRKYGFTNIDGLDLSPKMLAKAKEKNAYKNYICAAVTEKRLDIETGAYDAAIIVGAVTSGYIKANAFDEILRLVKPGGHIVFTIRPDVYDVSDFDFAPKFQQFIDDGKWIQTGKYLTDYVIGTNELIRNCYVVSYKVLKNE